MRLSKIRLSGFKSFVDPTTIQFPTNLCGVVGPNGCGKSNIIDAVRWVMGESSARHLRGEALADVIFNGSSARKPVGQASIELVFDNSDGAVGGEYAAFNEISVRRQLSREGASAYFLNGTRCRRRDITDIFLGTGLGPRSYAIIEQGMISRLIEARPDELRVLMEEAAGISRYKERRRETENRIRHTRENIARLDDLREELDRHLGHLQRQARGAERFKKLKAEEHRLRVELAVIRWREHGEQAAVLDAELAQQGNRHDKALAEQRGAESGIERLREQLHSANDDFRQIQERYYAAGADIARLEQAIQHRRELHQRQAAELERARQNHADIEARLQHDRQQLQRSRGQTAQLEPELERARSTEQAAEERVVEAERALHEWAGGREAHAMLLADRRREVEVEQARLQQIDNRMAELLQRREQIAQALQRLGPEGSEEEAERLREEHDGLRQRQAEGEQALQRLLRALEGLRDRDVALEVELSAARDRLREDSGRQASLRALQQASREDPGGRVANWLGQVGLSDRPRLAQRVRVVDGWERAVETVLGNSLEAVCAEDLDRLLEELARHPGGSLAVVASDGAADGEVAGASLARWVEGPPVVRSLLAGVFAAEDLAAAAARRKHLEPGESVVTRDGLWLSRNWIRVVAEDDGAGGVLARERALEALDNTVATGRTAVDGLERERSALRERISEVEHKCEDARQELAGLQARVSDSSARLNRMRLQLQQARERRETLQEELQTTCSRLEQLEEASRQARGALEQAMGELPALEEEGVRLQQRRTVLDGALEEARRDHRDGREVRHALELRLEARRSTEQSAARHLETLVAQRDSLARRCEELGRDLQRAAEPEQGERDRLETLLEQRVAVEQELGAARARMDSIDVALREAEQQRRGLAQQVTAAREELEQARLRRGELHGRQQSLSDQLQELGADPEAVAADLPADARAQAWETRLERVSARIERLGPINLAAIEEYAGQSERKAYLDRQHRDLTEALETLENAIRRIDRETRARFRETFDKVNQGVQTMFPRLFGGGHAYLDLSGEDLLDTGVTVMARPPGKRNSTIHLLSGGEKALTAVALVFAIFELNPAPFCMLDEVDAPLDDANVGRFCELVRDMSERVQFIMVTHNKSTMELADHLMGITMHEPGVSRMVSVDVDEAMEMAAV